MDNIKRFVWLVSAITTGQSAAATSFKLDIGGAREGRDDLAKGAGGDYRFIIEESDPSNVQKIVNVWLLRSDSAIDSPPEGYSGMTTDINKGRGGNHLYVVWRAAAV